MNYRQSLELLLARVPGFTLARRVARAEPLVTEVEAGVASCNLVLMDLGPPDMIGIDATRRLKAADPRLAVVVLTVFEEPATILTAISAGIDGARRAGARGHGRQQGVRALTVSRPFRRRVAECGASPS